MNAQRKFSELSPSGKFAVATVALVQLSLLVAALVDLTRRDASEVKGSKGLWAAASFINFVGPLAYFIFGRKKVAN